MCLLLVDSVLEMKNTELLLLQEMLLLLLLAIVQVNSAGFQNSVCLEPLPVAHAFRRWIPDEDPKYGKVRYECVDGYQATVRSTTRSCQMLSQNVYGYSEIAPVCELTCGEARNISAATKTWNTTVEGGRTSYSCFQDYGSDMAFVDCSPALDRWTHTLLYCKTSLDLRNASATQDPNAKDTPAPLAIDNNPSSCSATRVATRTQLNVTLSDYPADIMAVKLILKMNSTDTQVIIRAEVSGGQLTRCDWANVSRADSLNNTVMVKLQCSQTPNKPFGNVLMLSATFGNAQSNLQVCDVDVKGTCHFPPRIYPLRLVTKGLTSFAFGDVLFYVCEDGFTPLNGSGKTLCDVDSQWTSPTLQCTDEVDRTATVTPNVTIENSGWRAFVTLETQLEMYGVYVANKGNLTVSAASEGLWRNCAATQEGDDGVFVLCERRPVAKTLSVFLPQATKLPKSAIKVFGRPFLGALECLQTPSGAEYKGQLNVTKSGLRCLPWRSVGDSPYTEEMFSDDVLKEGGNFCRNPNGEQVSPWCYVNQRGPIAESCDLLMCEEFCKVRPDGTDYKGDHSVTASFKRCMNWSEPTLPFRRASYFPDLDLNHATCRNPAASQTAPWCYVTDRDHIVSDIEAVNTTVALPYDLCDIADCPTSVSFICLTQDIVSNSPYGTITKECNGGDKRHFRSGLTSFVRQICMNASNRTATTLCLFQDRSQNVFWAFVFISCQDSLTASVTSPTFSLETFTSSQPQPASFPSAQLGTRSPTSAVATSLQVVSFAVSDADKGMSSLGIHYSTSEDSSVLSTESNYLLSEPKSVMYNMEESKARINWQTSKHNELEHFASDTVFLFETDLQPSQTATSTFWDDSHPFSDKSSYAVGSDSSAENFELADWSQLETSSVRSSLLDISDKSSSALVPTSDTDALPTSSLIMPGCRGKCHCTFLQTTSSAELNYLETFTRSVQQNLVLNMSTLSYRRRKLTCAYDSRISAIVAGSFAVGVLVFSCLVVSASDIVQMSVLAIAILKRTQ